MAYFYFRIKGAVAAVYAFTANDNAAPFLGTGLGETTLLIFIPAAPVLAFYTRKKMVLLQNPIKNEALHDEGEPQQKSDSGTTAKVELGMGAIALAKSRGPSEVPKVTARDFGARNINTVHKKKNIHVMTYEFLHPSGNW